METRAEWYFDHEKLEVYQLARRFNRELHRLLENIPHGYGESKDNLRRAAKSVTRNIAEGAGKWRIPDKVRFYHIARGSGTECAASLDELVDFGMAADDQIRPLKQLMARIVSMLIRMIRSLEDRRQPDMS